MKTQLISVAALALLGAAPAPTPALAPSEIVAAAPTADWVAIAPADLLVMKLANGKQVIIQLMPAPFSQEWIGNIRTLAAAKWWDGLTINRVQDNYVVQWGDASEKKALPAGLAAVAESDYQQRYETLDKAGYAQSPIAGSGFDNGNCSLVSKYTGPCEQWARPSDPYSDGIFFANGWPFAGESTPVSEGRRSWPVHCYGMVGVGRNLPPDTGSGAELYTVIGHAPRHLDRNIALVGRVIEGIEHLASLPRGTEALGFYKTPGERTTITSIRIGTETAGLPRFEYLSTESESFATYADARANRRDPFFIKPAGGADICNIPVPVRRVK